MNYYKTKIQYAGTNYSGFQWQNDTSTIQSEFNKALSQFIDGKFTTMAASRTDTGVHAIEQVVKISSYDKLDLNTFLESLNKYLPLDIRCLSIQLSEGLFKPSITASKEYRYFFTNINQAPKEQLQFIANISNKLDINAMKICTNALVGEHDFCNFYSSGSNVKSTIRNISFCELTDINPQDIFSNFVLFHIPENLVNVYQLRIIANGFLKQMIRHIVSALWMVGSGKITSDDFIQLLNGPKIMKQHWKVASPNGLFLYQICYAD